MGGVWMPQKKPSTEVSTLNIICLMTILMIDCYHQKAENFLCLSGFFSPKIFPGLFSPPSTMNKIPHLCLPKALCTRKCHQADTKPCL